ncbi:MAG TPA: GNAT family N-acetyltransferase [Alphaproteobacteria bacterium]|nr:GNAT family N-acetyltransferase [Alphaproteobacteria bacterium]HOO51073.1 GNAT family N-acetyltransferase [Alphaproteobacteria bacterium]
MCNTIDPILIDIPFPIMTPRLMIRNVMPGDGEAMHEVRAESWEDLKKWMDWANKDIGDARDAEKIIRENYAKYILREDMMCAAFTHDGRLIALCGLHRFDWTTRSFDIGYYVRSSEHNKGYATELANALTRFAFGALNANRVSICAATGNAASRRVIEKLEFGLETVTKFDAFLPDGSPTGHASYVRYDIESLPDLEVSWANELRN